MCVLVSGCELLCQAGTGTCGMGKEQMERLLNPKPYGAHWVKGGASAEQWRENWINCGGLPNGGYIDGAPQRSSNEVIFAADREKRNELAACMRQLGYAFHPGAVFRLP